jgi:hypothetical protein
MRGDHLAPTCLHPVPGGPDFPVELTQTLGVGPGIGLVKVTALGVHLAEALGDVADVQHHVLRVLPGMRIVLAVVVMGMPMPVAVLVVRFQRLHAL